MMKRELLKVSIRKNAIVIPNEWVVEENALSINETTSTLFVNCLQLGYTFSQELYEKINGISPKAKLEILALLKEVTGVNKNWTPLVKQWDIPTGESYADHVITWLANVLPFKNGTQLPCGHKIPQNTFPLDRYNGCPFCGTPFEFSALQYEPLKNKMKVLELWTEEQLKQYLIELLESPVALDATQIEDLKILLKVYPLPDTINITMKETMIIAIDSLVEQNNEEKAGELFNTPTDILRYLWYKHTGFLQIIEPKTIAKRLAQNARNLHPALDKQTKVKIQSLQDLKLKYTRAECKRYAAWLNGLEMDIAAQCENMHPKRGMWVRVIRALRLAEYSKRKGFENLSNLLDTFYHMNYEVWQGKLDKSKLKVDAETTFKMLKQRPGLFARSLFSTMLWFGPEITIQHFKEVMDQVPARLIFTLYMYADFYFDKNAKRTVKPLGGVQKKIAANPLVQLYEEEDLMHMQSLIKDLSLTLIKENLSAQVNENETLYIDQALYKIPLAIGDRSEHVQDLPGAPMGTRFQVEGDTVRLFLQWGNGLPAQHLDMDLSCNVIYEDRSDFCSYARLSIPGCQHSGDIQRIPNEVGTAEYIDIDLANLQKLGAKYVAFTCNAYTNGSLSPNMVVGWMNSQYPMKVKQSGVAYNPTAVQHQVRIKQSLSKGMVFGVLDIDQYEIIWLEMSFGGQVTQNMNIDTVIGLLNKLDAKLKIGDLLVLKAEVQGLEIVDDATLADEVYDFNWALNMAQVNKLFLETEN